MKKMLCPKLLVAKPVRLFLSVLLSIAMLFELCAYAEKEAESPNTAANETDAIQPVVVEREAGPEALQVANEATAMALRYYIYARLETEAFITADFSSMPDGAFESQMDELVLIWETADILSTGAEKITDQAILLLKASFVDQTAAFFQTQPQYMNLLAKGSGFSAIPLAYVRGREIDPETWAENLTEQYDALRGGQRHKQLAQQLGTDLKTAVEQMALAQKIIHNQADMEEAQAEIGAYTRSIKIVEGYKAASKVGLFIGATVATGGGSLASLAGSSMSLGTAAAVVVGGVDCIVDVGATASSIILGEDHQVTMDFQKAGDVLQPISMVMGLATMNPNDTVEKIALVGESIMEWFVPGKITGIGIERAKNGGTKMIAQLVDAADTRIPGARETLKKALEAIGLSLPSDKEVTLENLLKVHSANSMTSLARMQELAAQIGVQGWEAPTPDLPPQEIEPVPSDVPPQETATGAITAQEMAGTYSGNATLQYIVEDMEGPDSLPVTLQLGEGGTGTVNVNGYGGEAQYTGSSVAFTVKMKDKGVTILCVFDGKVSRSGSQIVISGDMSFNLMGVNFCSYSWTGQK